MKKFSYRHTIAACCTGYITQSAINNFVPLLFTTFNSTLGIPMTKITVLITINFCIQLFIDLVSAKVIDRIGYRASMVIAHIFAGAGLALLAVLPQTMPDPFVGILICVFLYAIGGGLLEVLVSPIVEACPGENKAAVMGLLHSFYCWGTVAVILISTLFFTVFGRENWRIMAVIWSLLPFANCIFFTKVPINTLTEDGEGLSIGTLCRTKIFALFVILMLCSGAAEQSISQWASTFAERGLGITKTLGDLLGPCLFSVFMGTARIIYSKLSIKIPIYRLLIISGVLCIASYLTASLAANEIVSLIGCAFCGFSVGAMWPGAFSIAGEKLPTGGTTMFALLALAGDMGCAGGPTLVGFLSDAFDGDMKTALLFAIIFPVMLIIGCIMLKKKKNTAR